MKKYAKRVLVKYGFVVLWTQQEVNGATKWVQNTLHNPPKHLFGL